MTSKSSFLPRISLQRGDAPVLPLYNQSSAIRKKPSEYDLAELSPRPDEGIQPDRRFSAYDRRSDSPSAAFSDKASTAGSDSKNKGRQRVLFAGPPPPIATSRILYRDEEDRDRSPPARGLDASSLVRNINSVLFDRSPSRGKSTVHEYEPDTVWRNLQRRERTLQKELQLLLDAQSAGLEANLDPTAAATRSDASDAGSSTTASTIRRSHVTFEEPIRATPSGEIIPVRQPRRKPIGLRAARAGIGKNIMLLADLKAEEDANLTAALSTRKKALALLRKLSSREEGIKEELRVLEGEEDEPLTRELKELGEEHEGVTAEIAELEERLVGLRNRKRWLSARIEDVRSRREAGLSGYKGALREVENRLSSLLTRPPVKPLDVDAIVGEHGQQLGDHEVEQSPGGAEFLRMLPERRTVEMARDWWETEVAILERRKSEVDRERTALEQGVQVWNDAIRLVADFEADLRREMKAGLSGGVDQASTTPEEAMRSQLGRMSTIMKALEDSQHVAEVNGWNLLICAIGAELEAFTQGQRMLDEALRGSLVDVDGSAHSDKSEEDERTPQLGRSMNFTRASAVIGSNMRNSGSLRGSDVFKNESASPGPGTKGKPATLVDIDKEGDNEVPADLLVAEPQDHGSPTLSRDDSENEVPPEFLAQHHGDDSEME
ncbi:hypothetical protein QBC47DRAFT_175822 [Echria macrotheca]|uniref:Autophagy-related protein 28 n=1 Tax=Echria macrotheca TaxID=438768 RepID=A0AAJ0FDG4_9PEZI|nr:hypothetical protein QBC47DRAFT_175822 [Echria macrotheca]